MPPSVVDGTNHLKRNYEVHFYYRNNSVSYSLTVIKPGGFLDFSTVAMAGIIDSTGITEILFLRNQGDVSDNAVIRFLRGFTASSIIPQ